MTDPSLSVKEMVAKLEERKQNFENQTIVNTMFWSSNSLLVLPVD